MSRVTHVLLLGLLCVSGCSGGAAAGGALSPLSTDPAPSPTPATNTSARPVTPVTSARPTIAPVTASTMPAWAAQGSGELPHMADAFVDSIGINTHLHFDNNSPYNARYAQFAPLLEATGIRHIRDGLVDSQYQPYYDHLKELGAAGIHATLITSVGQSASLFQSFPSRVGSALEAYEAPNEYDDSGDPNWAADLTAFLPKLYAAVKSYGPTAGYPVIGPSLIAASDDAALGNQSAHFDYGNIHNYFSGFNPGTPGWGGPGFGSSYGSILYNMRSEAQVSAQKPIIATETGYCTEANTADAIPSNIQGRYVPRLFLEQFNNGIVRTFEYEFSDEGTGYFSACGLTTFGLTPKPAYYALSNVIHLLGDQGTSFTPIRLPYTLDGSTSNVMHTLLQKRNGTYYLALWIEQLGFDPNALQPIAIPPQNITVTLPDAPASAALSTLDDTGAMITAPLRFSGATMNLTLSDRVTILSFTMPGLPTTLH
jgi:hypothetical protein